MVYALCFALFVIGLYCALTKKNIVKIVIGITIMEYAVNLFLVLLGYRKDGVAPIVEEARFGSLALALLTPPPIPPDFIEVLVDLTRMVVDSGGSVGIGASHDSASARTYRYCPAPHQRAISTAFRSTPTPH